MVRAFRDTWKLGIHSYLTYLRDRLLLARELLHESGSCFVQISAENLHLVRNLMDDVFAPSFRARVVKSGRSLAHIRYVDDFPVSPLTDIWLDTGTGSFTDPKLYVVQTNTKVLLRIPAAGK